MKNVYIYDGSLKIIATPYITTETEFLEEPKKFYPDFSDSYYYSFEKLVNPVIDGNELREMKRVSKRLVIVEETYDSLFSKLDLVYRDIYVNLFAGQSSKIHWGSYFSTISIKDTFEELDLQVLHSNTKPHRNYYKETYVVEQK